mgnify:CR=1 FL=1
MHIDCFMFSFRPIMCSDICLFSNTPRMLPTKFFPSLRPRKVSNGPSNNFDGNDKSARNHPCSPVYDYHHQHPSEALALVMNGSPCRVQNLESLNWCPHRILNRFSSSICCHCWCWARPQLLCHLLDQSMSLDWERNALKFVSLSQDDFSELASKAWLLKPNSFKFLTA